METEQAKPITTAEPKFRIKYYWNIILKTIFCLLVVLVLKFLIGIIFHFPETLNPLSNKIEDFELSDLCFAYGHDQVDQDTNIVIIDCHNATNNQVAGMISQIAKRQPRAIGLDFKFDNYDKNRDQSLVDSILKYKEKIVVAGPNVNHSFLEKPFYRTMFNRNDGNGEITWGYLLNEPRFTTRRYYYPFFVHNHDTLDAFPTAIIRLAYGDRYIQVLKSRDNKKELINYREAYLNKPRYIPIQKLSDSIITFENKIVLFGECDSSSIKDRHFTPLNGAIGRSYPDMFGVVYQAQVISMVVENDYLNQPGEWAGYFFIFLVCCIYMMLYNWIAHKSPNAYHIWIDAIAVFNTILFLFVCRLLLNNAKFKLEPTEYIIPLFYISLFVHLYEPLRDLIIKSKPFGRIIKFFKK